MAVRFSASGQHYTSLTSLPSAFTITMWVNQIADINRICILSAGSVSGDAISIISGASGLTLSLKGSTATIGSFVTSYNTWYKLAVTFDNGSAVFYHAGATSALTSDSGSIGTATGTGVYIGSSNETLDWFSGRIAAFKQWSAALSATEVDRELQFYVPQRTADISRFYPFVVAQTRDYSGLARTLSGGSGTSTEPGPPIAWSANNYAQLIIPWTAPVIDVASPLFRRAPHGALLQF